MQRVSGMSGGETVLLRVADFRNEYPSVYGVSELSLATCRRWFAADRGAFTFEVLRSQGSPELHRSLENFETGIGAIAVVSFLYELPVFADASELVHECFDQVRNRDL